MAQPKPLKARNETFGKTIYNPNTFTHLFVSEENFDNLKKESKIEEINNEVFSETSNILQAPIRTYYDLTFECNLRCKTCLNNSGRAAIDELNLEEALRIVEGLKKDGVFDVRFSGGEPTLKKNWDIILERAKELGLTITLNTNGICESKTLDRLIELNPDETTVSLDGAKRLNNYLRGRGSFEKAIGAIKKLKAAGCRVTINSVVTSLFCNEDIRELLEFADYYCDDISFFPYRPIGRGANLNGKESNYKEMGAIMRKIEELKENYPNLKVRTKGSSLQLNAISENKAKQWRLLEGGTDGFTRLNIMPNGDIYAGGCVPYVESSFQKELVLGNMMKENYSLLRVWRFSEKLKQIRAVSSELKKRCNRCDEYNHDCGGFMLEMELYRRINEGKNPYCKF